MKNLQVFLLALMLIIVCSSCSFSYKSELTNKTYPIQSFNSFKSNTVGNIIYTQSDKVSVKVEGEKEIIDNLTITEKDGLLDIKLRKKLRIRMQNKLTIYLSSPSIELIENSGVGNTTIEGKVKADNLKINFEGVGNFDASNLECQRIEVSCEGVGNLKIAGTTEFIDIESEGVGNVNTEELIAKVAVVNSSGVGSVKCFASDNIDIINSGVGSVTYFGNPAVKNMKNSGVGKIKQGN